MATGEEEHLPSNAEQVDDQPAEEHDGEEEDEAPQEDAVMDERSEKTPEPAPATQKRKPTTTTPPAKWQKIAPSDAGSSLASANESKGEEIETAPPILEPKPSRSIGGFPSPIPLIAAIQQHLVGFLPRVASGGE